MTTGKWYIEGKALDTVAGAGDWQIGIIVPPSCSDK
jgi:hypothetical protein